MSDLHIDYDYTEGMSSDCNKPLCCRSDSGAPDSPDKAAGKWGNYQCDLNEIALKNMLEFIKDELKPDLLLWGGDSIPHNVDSITLESNVQIMKNITKAVVDGLEGIKVYPAIGNHDTFPQDVIGMSIPKENKAINEWIGSWDSLIEDPKQLQTFHDWGYYSVPLRYENGTLVGNANTKLVQLNNNICYHFNWESITVFEDPGNMLQWFEDELKAIEKDNGTAIIMSHVPNLNECNRQYGKRYHSILDRFQHIIRWGLYAHIHQEQYQVVTDMTWKQPIGMNFIIGSATTFQGKPQSFNMLYADPDTMLPVFFETWAFDLDHANKFDEPVWRLKYNYTEEYDLPDLSPQSFYDLSERIYYNETVAKQYRSHRFIDGPGAPHGEDCKYSCRMELFCQTMSNDYDEWQFCRD